MNTSTLHLFFHRTPRHDSASIVLLASLLAAIDTPAFGQGNYTPYRFTTIAGLASSGSNDGPAGSARFWSPVGIAIDGSGNRFVADAGGHTIRKITPGGVVSTLAGLAGVTGSADGTGSAARFNRPLGVATDLAGNVYVADTSNFTVRKITPEGTTTTLAGLAGWAGSADGTGSAARFYRCTDVAVDLSGNVYVADSDNYVIRKVTPIGIVTTLAGLAKYHGYVDGVGSSARFQDPSSVTVDGTGNVYVADVGNGLLRKITPDGLVSTVAGLTEPRSFGSAVIYRPWGLAADPAGNVCVADAYSCTIRKISPEGTITTLAGLAGAVRGAVDGMGSAARFGATGGIAVEAGGTVLVADSLNNTIRRITPDGDVTTIAGVSPPQSTGSIDGVGAAARFNDPRGVIVGPTGQVFVADTANHTIRVIAPDGTVSTVAGLPGVSGSADGRGNAARFNRPTALAIDGAGSLYVADTVNDTIRRVAADGTTTTVAGLAGQEGSTDGTGSNARFRQPLGIAADRTGSLFVADTGNYLVRKITPDGVVSTLAGLAGVAGTVDGSGSAALFARPSSVAASLTGDLFVGDYDLKWGLGGIRRISATAAVTSLCHVAPDPEGLAVDAAGDLFVTGSVYCTVYRVDQSGHVFQLAGFVYDDIPGSLDGTGYQARFSHPGGIAVDAAGQLFVADSGNNTIRKGVPDQYPVLTRSPQNRTVTAGQSTTFAAAAGSVSATSYRWQVLTPGAGSWIDLGDDAHFSGTGTPTLRVDSATASMDGDLLRCVIVNADGSVQSDAARLTVLGGPLLTIRTWSGKAGVSGSIDGPIDGALFNAPTDLALDAAGNLFVADTNNHTIRRVSRGGTVSTLAGLANAAGSADGTGTAARFSHPSGVAVDGAGNVFVCDTDNCVIRKITADGMVTTLAGLARTPGYADGLGTAARFRGPSGIVADRVGNLYVADTVNYNIRKITPDGMVTTLAGLPPWDPNSPSTVTFWGPQGLVLDGAGSLVVADTNSGLIRKVDLASSAVTTVAGGNGGSDDGPGATAQFNHPSAIARDRAGNLFLADTDNSTIRRIAADGTVSTVAGLATVNGSADGTGAAARFNFPAGIAVDASGNIFIADTNNHTIRVAESPAAPPSGGAGPTSGDSGSSSDNSGTASGGGGAMDGWFAGVLGILLVGRAFSRFS